MGREKRIKMEKEASELAKNIINLLEGGTSGMGVEEELGNMIKSLYRLDPRKTEKLFSFFADPNPHKKTEDNTSGVGAS